MPRRSITPNISTLWKRDMREAARASGMCQECCKRPAAPRRATCAPCLMRAQVKSAFQRHSKAKRTGLSCYVDGYSIEWVRQVEAKFTGVCAYTGWPIAIGSTAAIDHVIPVSRVGRAYSAAQVHHPDNLVWCHYGANALKADMTGTEFKEWLRQNLPLALSFLNQEAAA